MFAGVNGAPEHVGNPPKIKASPRVGVAYQRELQNRRARRLRDLLGAVAVGCTAAAGYSQTTALQQDVCDPITTIDNPFPNGLTPISGNATGLLTGVSTNISFIDPDRTRRVCISIRWTCSGSCRAT